MMKTVHPDSPNVQYGMTYVSKVEDGFINHEALTRQGPMTLQTTVTAPQDGRPMDSFLFDSHDQSVGGTRNFR